MPLNRKVVSLNKLHNFYIGRIWSVYVKFGERDKGSGWQQMVKGVLGVLTRVLTKGALVDQSGSFGDGWWCFRGDGPGWLSFDQSQPCLTRALGLKTRMKTWGVTPPAKRTGWLTTAEIDKNLKAINPGIHKYSLRPKISVFSSQAQIPDDSYFRTEAHNTHAHSSLWIHVRKSYPYERLRRTEHRQIWKFLKSAIALRRWPFSHSFMHLNLQFFLPFRI
jgi:hypothetical protein